MGSPFRTTGTSRSRRWTSGSGTPASGSSGSRSTAPPVICTCWRSGPELRDLGGVEPVGPFGVGGCEHRHARVCRRVVSGLPVGDAALRAASGRCHLVLCESFLLEELSECHGE